MVSQRVGRGSRCCSHDVEDCELVLHLVLRLNATGNDPDRHETELVSLTEPGKRSAICGPVGDRVPDSRSDPGIAWTHHKLVFRGSLVFSFVVILLFDGL